MARGPERLAAGVALLRELRQADRGWRRFPFHYTCLALSEMDLPGAAAEIQHAAPRLERLLKRASPAEGFDARRRAVAERLLGRV